MSISVIIPTFNRAALLPRAVASVLAQDWRPLEIVIVDDGSSDETPSVIRGLPTDVPVIAVRQPNQGEAAARNAGLKAAGGEWIAFLDDDDTRRPGSLARQHAAARGADACSALVAVPGGTKPAGAARLLDGRCGSAFLRGEQSAAITSLLVRRKTALAVGEFERELRIGCDMEWIARLAQVAEFRALPEVVADYNQTPGALSHVADLAQQIEHDKYDLRAVELLRQRCPGAEPAALARFAARTCDRCAKHLMYAGRLADAQALIERGQAAGAETEILNRTLRKLRKAKLLALVGRRIKHPKYDDARNIPG